MSFHNDYYQWCATILVMFTSQCLVSCLNHSSSTSPSTPPSLDIIIPHKRDDVKLKYPSLSPSSSIIVNNINQGRIYLIPGNITKESIVNVINNNDNNNFNRPISNKLQTSIHIYVIFFIGFMPACLGALVWWIQNRCFANKNKCLSSFCCCCPNHLKSTQQSSNYNDEESMINNNNNIEKLKHPKRYDDKISLTYITANNGIVKSRPIYPSYEIPRKNLQMLEILGEGNFGQVWKARSCYPTSIESQLVAVKTNKLSTSDDETENEHQQQDLLKELDIMVQLGSHPNVVRLLGCCTEHRPYYIVMEFVSQGKLLSYLRRHRDDYFDTTKENYTPKIPQLATTTNRRPPFINNNNYMTYYSSHPNEYAKIQIDNSKKGNNNDKSSDDDTSQKESLSPYDLIHFAYQIAKGMEFISSHGIIHRDLAVRNVLIDENKNCKVADFGLSRSIRDKDSDMYEMRHGGQVPVRWMSPEALTMGIFSIKSDVWAFGIVLWEIVTLGSTPYIGMSAPEVINFIRQGNICTQPEHCNNDLYDLMKSCWAYKADDRFTFTQIKYHLMKMLLAIQQDQIDYIDLENFNNSLYYFNTSSDSPDEKL